MLDVAADEVSCDLSHYAVNEPKLSSVFIGSFPSNCVLERDGGYTTNEDIVLSLRMMKNILTNPVYIILIHLWTKRMDRRFK
jgi:hypothetical protein